MRTRPSLARAGLATPARLGGSVARVVAVLSGITVGCGGDTALGPAPAALVGSYALVALNDRPLPADLSPDPTRTRSTRVVEGTLTLNRDRTYVRTELLRDYRADGSAVAGAEWSDTTRGTFIERGPSLTFRSDFGGGAFGTSGRVLDLGTATVAGANLTYTDLFIVGTRSSPYVYTYAKR